MNILLICLLNYWLRWNWKSWCWFHSCMWSAFHLAIEWHLKNWYVASTEWADHRPSPLRTTHLLPMHKYCFVCTSMSCLLSVINFMALQMIICFWLFHSVRIMATHFVRFDHTSTHRHTERTVRTKFATFIQPWKWNFLLSSKNEENTMIQQNDKTNDKKLQIRNVNRRSVFPIHRFVVTVFSVCSNVHCAVCTCAMVHRNRTGRAQLQILSVNCLCFSLAFAKCNGKTCHNQY